MPFNGPGLIDSWIRDLRDSNDPDKAEPHDKFDPTHLKTLSTIHALTIGTGHGIFSHVLPFVETAQSEVIFVTCFWARSSSLDQLSRCLQSLSHKGEQQRTKIRVRICLSSVSALQKVFHTSSQSGHTYPSSQWEQKFGIPSPEKLGGLDLEIKSVFIRPFSVMHPKFIIIDRKHICLPSCNVSWENWFEGSIHVSGPIVHHFLRFYSEFWATSKDRESLILPTSQDDTRNWSNPTIFDSCTFLHDALQPSLDRPSPANLGFRVFPLNFTSVQSVFLLSPHHVNPRFRPLPWQETAPPPPTPLNTFLLHAFRNAKSTIYVQTPNVTSPPVLKELLIALERGVDVHILTSERLMILEQLVTAGTTTSRCMKKLKKDYQKLAQQTRLQAVDEEQGLGRSMGKLKVEFFVKATLNNSCEFEPEPVQSHLKLTIIDDECIIFGSGNMDRASWYTSQELGVAFTSQALVKMTRKELAQCLDSRTQLHFDSSKADA
ncbi:MAG: hypothetical protein M1820_003468 [Bogoriella megaspora]|nr:MAG: hypothetical protein M1820_003468 [Bogoriella megaspora]